MKSGLTNPNPASNFERFFGTVIPSSIPESTAWWRRQGKELAAITDDIESGLMQLMITITHNNLSPEYLACVRRGPFAVPTESEKIEYLLGRVPKTQRRCPFESSPLEHVLSYQRRVAAIKKQFLVRGKLSPIGVVYDYWDRTEARGRGPVDSCCVRLCLS